MPNHIDTSIKNKNVDRDPRLFMWFLTLVMVTMYAIALIEKPELRQSWQLIVFTALMAIHVFLHWQIEKIIINSKTTVIYILVQGILGFFICWMAGNEGIIFAIFMALLGEVVGILGLSRATLIASLYYLILVYINLRHIMDEGSSSWMLIGIIPVIIFVITYVTLYRRQTDAREQAQALATELEKVNQQLSQYASQVEDLTIANERQRMARELHDTLSQGLTGIILQLEAVEAHLSNDRVDKARAIVSNAMLQARAALADARNAIDDLRNTSVENLESALRLEISRFTSATDIPCEFLAEDIPTLSKSLNEAIVRNVAEALTNIARHAQANKVKVEVSTDTDRLIITIQDNGQGFDSEVIPSGHYGVLGMQERVRLAGGEFEIKSQLGVGTKIRMKTPL
ncbi:MAG: sensor histidine kinase [Anaerolineaceae bacterium]|nr:sensor histidine kinase [Anaerolineaceae bacterium]